MDPINYMLDVKNPIEEAIRGYTMGRNEIAQQQEMQIQRQNATMEQQAFEDQQAALQKQRAAAEKAVADAAAGQAAVTALIDLGDNATPDDFMRTWAANPAMRDDIASLLAMMTEQKTKATINTTQDLYVSSSLGNVDATKGQIQTQYDAAVNSGDETMAKTLKVVLDQFAIDPEAAMRAVKTTSGLTLGGFIGFDKLKLLNEAAGIGAVEAAEAASPLGKLAQDVDKGILPKSVLDSAIKLERMNAEGGLTLKDKVAEEARLRGEYGKRTENLTAANRNYSIIETSAASGTGAGDIALITSFMKMLDDQSVVRETEFALAQNAGGLLSYLKTLPEKIESGQLLTPKQRTEFQVLARQYLEAAQAQEPVVRQSYQAIVDDYGLNPVNVFGVQAATAQPNPAETPTTSPAPIVGGANSSLDFSAMTKADLLAVDVMSLTSEQKAAMLKRFSEVNAGP
jgi:hypothetical protein